MTRERKVYDDIDARQVEAVERAKDLLREFFADVVILANDIDARRETVSWLGSKAECRKLLWANRYLDAPEK